MLLVDTRVKSRSRMVKKWDFESVFDAMCVEIGVTFLIWKVADLADSWRNSCVSIGLLMLQVATSFGHRHMNMTDDA